MLQSPVGIITLNISFVLNEFTIAAEEDHKETLIDLTKITEQQIYNHVASDASVMALIAQRVDHNFKIKASIE